MFIDNKFKPGDVVTIKGETSSVDEDYPIGFQRDTSGKILRINQGYTVVYVPEINAYVTYDTSDLTKTF